MKMTVNTPNTVQKWKQYRSTIADSLRDIRNTPSLVNDISNCSKICAKILDRLGMYTSRQRAHRFLNYTQSTHIYQISKEAHSINRKSKTIDKNGGGKK